MPNKHRLNIDLAKLQGAVWFKSPKTGEMCLVIVPSKSRFKFYKAKAADKPDSLYASLEIVPFKNAPLDREDTHFVVEPTTREEREQPDLPKLPIIGSAREYLPYNTPAPTAPPQRQAQAEGWDEAETSIASSLADEDYPF